MLRLGLAAVLFATLSLGAAPARAAGCTKDSDCKGDRVCSDAGKCVAPDATPAKPAQKERPKPKAADDAPPSRYARGRRTPDSFDDGETRWGVMANLLGPNALVGAGIIYQPNWWFEWDAIVGYDRSEASGTTSTAGVVTANATALTFMSQARFWLMRGHHAPVLEVGAGVTHLGYEASATTFGGYDQISYARSGSPGFVSAGVGYAYRAGGWFRFAATIGVVSFYEQLDRSSVSSSSGFTPADREDLQTSLDATTDEATKLHPYLQVTFGATF